jgi:large subunit ribosomal protein L24
MPKANDARRVRRTKRRIRIVRSDRVRVIRGNYRDAEGVVIRVDARAGCVVVEGVNMRVRHQRPTQENPEGGIISFEAPIDISNVMLIEPSSGEASRVRIQHGSDGAKERISVKSGYPIPRP